MTSHLSNGFLRQLLLSPSFTVSFPPVPSQAVWGLRLQLCLGAACIQFLLPSGEEVQKLLYACFCRYLHAADHSGGAVYGLTVAGLG